MAAGEMPTPLERAVSASIGVEGGSGAGRATSGTASQPPVGKSWWHLYFYPPPSPFFLSFTYCIVFFGKLCAIFVWQILYSFIWGSLWDCVANFAEIVLPFYLIHVYYSHLYLRYSDHAMSWCFEFYALCHDAMSNSFDLFLDFNDFFHSSELCAFDACLWFFPATYSFHM